MKLTGKLLKNMIRGELKEGYQKTLEMYIQDSIDTWEDVSPKDIKALYQAKMSGASGAPPRLKRIVSITQYASGALSAEFEDGSEVTLGHGQPDYEPDQRRRYRYEE